MTKKKSRLMFWTEQLFVAVKVSVLFWVVLLKKGMVYAWIPAIKTAFEFIQLEHPYDESWWQFSKKKTEGTLFEKFLSFLLTLAFILAMTSWLSLMRVYTDIYLIVFVLASFVWIVGILFSTVYVYKENDHVSQRIYETLFYMVKHTQQLLILALFIGMSSWFTLTKNIIGWFIFPGFYLMIDKKLKQIDRKQKK